ncbi:MAG: hypothetical protein AAF986_10700 [Pseudomonadota bacterium]
MSSSPDNSSGGNILRIISALIGVLTFVYLGATGEKIGSTPLTILIYLVMGVVSLGTFYTLIMAIARVVGKERLWPNGGQSVLWHFSAVIAIAVTGGIVWFALNLLGSAVNG